MRPREPSVENAAGVLGLGESLKLLMGTADATSQLQDLILAHEKRLKTLEKRLEDRGKRVPKKKRRRRK